MLDDSEHLRTLLYDHKGGAWVVAERSIVSIRSLVGDFAWSKQNLANHFLVIENLYSPESIR